MAKPIDFDDESGFAEQYMVERPDETAREIFTPVVRHILLQNASEITYLEACRGAILLCFGNPKPPEVFPRLTDISVQLMRSLTGKS